MIFNFVRKVVGHFLFIGIFVLAHSAQSSIAVVHEPCTRGPDFPNHRPMDGHSLASRLIGLWFYHDNDPQAAQSWLNQNNPNAEYDTNNDFVSTFYNPTNIMSQCTLFIYVYDEISLDDVDKLKAILAGFANPPFLHVTLNSPGGSIQAGIALGKIIRLHYGVVNVNSHSLQTATNAVKTNILTAFDRAGGMIDKDKLDEELASHHRYLISLAKSPDGKFSDAKGICYSACVLVYAGGISRLAEVDASVGVHQHFFADDYLMTLPVETAIELLRQTSKEIASYFDELGVNPELLQIALSTNKDQMRILDLCELQILLPFAVSEYANVIPEKFKQHLRLLDDLAIRYFKDSVATGTVSGLADTLSYSYAILEREKPDIKWTAFYEYGLTKGKSLQKQDWTEINCGRL